MVKRRARLADVEGDWAGHSLRSGFVTEAGRQGVPLGEVMAMTEHRSVGTAMGYFQAGTLLSSAATDLLKPNSSFLQGCLETHLRATYADLLPQAGDASTLMPVGIFKQLDRRHPEER